MVIELLSLNNVKIFLKQILRCVSEFLNIVVHIGMLKYQLVLDNSVLCDIK